MRRRVRWYLKKYGGKYNVKSLRRELVGAGYDEGLVGGEIGRNDFK